MNRLSTHFANATRVLAHCAWTPGGVAHGLDRAGIGSAFDSIQQ